MKQPTKAIITDAGFASRYLPIAKTIPKGMLPIDSKPIMQLVVEECAQAGIKEVIIVATAEGAPIYEDYFTNSVPHVRDQLTAQGKEDRYASVLEVLDLPKVYVITQDPELPYGNGSPIASAKNYIADEEAFIVAYSDDIVLGGNSVADLIEMYQRYPDAKAIVAAQEVAPEEVSKYGMFKLKDEARLEYIVEKPAETDTPSLLASYGRYLVTPEIFEHLDPANIGLDNELWTVDAITKMAHSGDVIVCPTSGNWQTTGDPKNYFLAHQQYVLDNTSYADEVRRRAQQ